MIQVAAPCSKRSFFSLMFRRDLISSKSCSVLQDPMNHIKAPRELLLKKQSNKTCPVRMFYRQRNVASHIENALTNFYKMNNNI